MLPFDSASILNCESLITSAFMNIVLQKCLWQEKLKERITIAGNNRHHEQSKKNQKTEKILIFSNNVITTEISHLILISQFLLVEMWSLEKRRGNIYLEC